MPDDHDARAGSGEPDGFNEPDDLDDLDHLDHLDDIDDIDDIDDADEPGGAGRPFPGPGYPPGGYPGPPGGSRRGGGGRARRGWLLVLTAVVAAAAGFGLVTVALRDAAASPTAASPAPGPSAPGAGGSGASPSGGGAGNGPRLSPRGGGIPSLPAGAALRLEVGGPVTAVSATSITVGRGDRAVTAAVTRATRVTGRVTGIGGIKAGDVVSASISGANGKLTATSIQDPASLPSAPGQ